MMTKRELLEDIDSIIRLWEAKLASPVGDKVEAMEFILKYERLRDKVQSSGRQKYNLKKGTLQ